RDERPYPVGREGQVRLQEPFELDQRLVVEGDIAQVGEGDATFPETVLDRLRREPGIVLLPGETLLLRGGHDRTVSNETGRAIVVKRRNTQDVHHPSCGAFAAPPRDCNTLEIE